MIGGSGMNVGDTVRVVKTVICFDADTKTMQLNDSLE